MFLNLILSELKDFKDVPLASILYKNLDSVTYTTKNVLKQHTSLPLLFRLKRNWIYYAGSVGIYATEYERVEHYVCIQLHIFIVDDTLC